MTKDNKIILWHDWSPNDVTSILRQEGKQPDNLYKPKVPGLLSHWREPTIELTLAEIREHYGYERIEGRSYGNPPTEPVQAFIPTLEEFFAEAKHWDSLSHLFLDIKMPAKDAKAHAKSMIEGIAAALPTKLPFAVTLLIPEESVLAEMRKYADKIRLAVAFSWDREFPPGIIRHPDKFSAIDSAIKYRNTVASVGRPTSATFEPWETYQKVIEYDIQRWEEYNLNPNLNKGNQISELIAWTINDIDEMEWLIQQGVSGIITDDIAMMKTAIAATA